MKDLFRIIEETPIAVRPLIQRYYTGPDGQVTIITSRGIVLKIPWKDVGAEKLGFSEYGIGLSYNCDNMGKTLVHEALHIKYPQMTENNVEFLTQVYWNKYPTLRQAAVRRVIIELE